MIRNLFPHPLLESSIPEIDCDSLVERILTDCKNNPERFKKDEWQCDVYASFSQYEYNQEFFKDIIPLLEQKCNEFATEIGLTHLPNHKMELNEIWWNYYPEGYWQEKHTHPGSSISGTLFLTFDESPTLFYNPNLSYLHSDPMPTKTGSDYNREYIKVFPETNKVVLFRSYMTHAVQRDSLPRQYERRRLTVAFNAVIVEK
jgi:uncharacterized protein (TIGR02466 family)